MILNKHLSFKRSFLALLIISIILLILSVLKHSINGDEAIIAEHSYWLNKVGFVKSKMFDGMGLGWETRQYHYHKLFVMVGALFLKVFGVSILAMRSISLIFIAIALFVVYRYSKSTSPKEYLSSVFFLTGIVLITNYNFIDYGIIFRPEAMLMTLGLISFYFLHTGITVHKKIFYVIAAVIAGLATFTHLNGVCFIFSGFLLLTVNKQYKSAMIFGAISSITSLLYFVDILTITELKAFWYQFTNDPNLNNNDLLNPLIKIVNEQSRLFWNANMTLFSSLTIICLILNFKELRKNHKNLLYYLVFLFFGLALFSHGKTLKYGLVYFPFMALIIGLSLPDFFQLKRAWKILVSIVFVVFLCVNMTSIVKGMLSATNTVARNEMKSRYMPRKHVNMIGNESFFFNQIENYTIHIRLAFSLYYEKYLKKAPTREDFFLFAEKRENHYIVVDKEDDTKEFLDLIEFDKLKEGDRFKNYMLTRKRDGFAIFELVK